MANKANTTPQRCNSVVILHNIKLHPQVIIVLNAKLKRSRSILTFPKYLTTQANHWNVNRLNTLSQSITKYKIEHGS